VSSDLRKQILSGKLPPNDLVPAESRLAITFGVSRVVIREAMRSLRAEGLIEVSQGRRARVLPVDATFAASSLGLLLQRSEGTLLHLLEARKPLEAEIAALAAERRTDAHLAAAREAIEAMEDASSLELAVEADIRFHQVLAEATGNPVFPMLLMTLGELLRDTRRRTLQASPYSYANAHHRKILQAMEVRDARTARTEMLNHLAHAGEDLKKNSV